MPAAKSIVESFEEKYVPEPNSGCWLWTGALCGGGYGCIGERGTRRVLQSHRVSWELHHGPIPEGLWVLHKCDIRACVNPDHLFLGTVKDNGADMAAKGRSRLGKVCGPQRNPRRKSKLSDDAIAEILQTKGRLVAFLARKFKVNRSTIYAIKNGTVRYVGG